MTALTSTINKEICDRFSPLSSIPNHMRDELLQHAMTASFDVYRNIVKHSGKEVLYHYLIDGFADVRHSFDKRTNISASDQKCMYPLEEQIKNGGIVRAITPCKVLIINKKYLDDIVARAATLENSAAVFLEENMSLEEPSISGDHKDDWMTLFYRSPLAMNLSPIQTQHVFSSLENVEVSDGELIIQIQTKGDFFYIIKEGYAEVISEKYGPFKGKSFELKPGDYFGDEALVAHTARNASVVMTSDGLLGRMTQSNFEKTIKRALVITPSKEEIDSFHNPIYCDVRLPVEYEIRHFPHSINIPVGKIRQHLDSFDKNLVYIITPDGEDRSKLAAYLMRQAGIEAYYMDNDLGGSIPTLHDQIAS